MIVNNRINDYLNSLNKDIPKELIFLEEEALKNNIPIIKKDTQNLLKYLLGVYKPKNILEIGTAIGFSALFISEYTLEDARITTIEKSIKRASLAKENFASDKFLNAKKVNLLIGDAFMHMEEIVAKGEKFDFVFLDAAKAQYMNFLPLILDLLITDGVLVTDNVLQDGTVTLSRYSIARRDRTIHYRMREYLYEITHIDKLNTIILPVGDGVAISNKT